MRRLNRLLTRPVRLPKRYLFLVFASIFFLLVFFVAGAGGCLSSNRKRINQWLEFHELSSLPKMATNIMYYQWNGLFTGETYIKVQMESNDVTAFIANSPGLSQGKSEIFTPEHQHLPFPRVKHFEFDSRHRYFQRSEMFPDWFDPTITNRGRGYILWKGPYSEVYVNEDTSTIYLRSVKG